MEVDSNFNAGYGGVLTRDGEVEMDACFMDGKTMDVGSVSGVQNIYHPISLARKVMEKTPYNFLGAKGAMKLAEDENFTFLKPGVLVSDIARVSLERWRNATGSGKFDVSFISHLKIKILRLLIIKTSRSAKATRSVQSLLTPMVTLQQAHQLVD